MSQTLPFGRVKDINIKYKNIVFGYIHTLPCSSQFIEIPKSIQLIILLFYYNAITSSILTNDESDKLLALFEENNKFNDLGHYCYKLIYKRSRDGWKVDDFKKRCHNIPNLLCLIHTDNNNVFGGYTQKGWIKKTSYDTYKDDKAFIFSIRSCEDYAAAIFNGKKGNNTLRSELRYYCIFGECCAIWIDSVKKIGGCYEIGETSDFEKPPYSFYLNGGRSYVSFVPLEIEVFQLVTNT